MSTRDSESGNNQQSATFQERLDALVGKPIRGDSVSHAPDPVNQPMIRHWAAAFEDHNAAYVTPSSPRDRGSAASSPRR